MSVSPAYLFTGPELGERNDAILSLRKKTGKMFSAVDEYSFHAADVSMADIISLLQNGSLFANARFVILNDADQIKKKEDIDQLADWISENSRYKAGEIAEAQLVLTADPISIDRKLEKLISADNKRIFWEMFEDRKIPWLENFFKKAGFQLDHDAAETILGMVENNTEALRTECSRFFSCFQPPHRITAAETEDILAHNREESAFTLFDTLANTQSTPERRLEAALLILQKLRLSGEGSGVQLIAGLAYCFRKLGTWHILHAGKNQLDDFSLKINGFAGKKMQAQYRMAASIWNRQQTAKITALLAQSDMDIRENGTATEDLLLQLLLYRVVMKQGGELSCYYPDYPA